MTFACRIVVLSILVLGGCQRASLTGITLQLTDDKHADNHKIAELADGEMTFKHVVIQSVDGLAMPGYFFTPLNSNSDPRPTIIHLHGGQHGTFSSRSMRHVSRFISKNWNVLALDYRGSGGYGDVYYDLADYGGMEIDDALAARDWLVEQGYAPANKIAVLGASHGGYNTLMALARRPDGFAAGVDFFGPTDLVYRVSSTPEENTNSEPGDPELFAKMVGATLEQDEQAYRDRSPRFLADKITAPVLVIHGTVDAMVNIRESQWLIEAFKQAGKTNYEYRVIEGANHGFPAELFDPEWEYAVKFLGRYLGQSVSDW